MIVGIVIVAVASLAIIGLGIRFWVSPQAAAIGYGATYAPEGDRAGYLQIKGSRDIVSGIVLLTLIALGEHRALGWATMAFALTPVADCAIVLRHGGSRAVAWGIHGVTAAVLVIAAVLVVTG